MNINLPIFVEAFKRPGQKHTYYQCRPLFVATPQALDPSLSRATSKLARDLKSQLDQLGRNGVHQPLADRVFSPELTTHRLKLTLDLRDRLARCSYLFVTFPALDRKVAFTPTIPEVWFELVPGDSLESRAVEVLTRHFREQARGGNSTAPEAFSLRGNAWVAHLALDIRTRTPTLDDERKRFAALWDDSHVDGAAELQRVGRCLDWLYPDDLDRAVGRQREVDELDRLLAIADGRPVMLVARPWPGRRPSCTRSSSEGQNGVRNRMRGGGTSGCCRHNA